MAIDLDDEILQDFLVEAGEILDQLGEQLVSLESRPTDAELLNAVFRGFHTIKGGAGFVGLTALVDICHRAEDVFNTLRQGDRIADAELMDVVLRVLDILNHMFATVKNGVEPEPAEADLLEQLKYLAQPGGGAQQPDNGGAVATEMPPEGTAASDADIGTAAESDAPAEQEVSSGPFKQDDTRQDTPSEPEAGGGEQDVSSEEISEEEFEALLDQLHGAGRHSGMPGQAQGTDAADSDGVESTSAETGSGGEAVTGTDATDEQFDLLLNQLHEQNAPSFRMTDSGETAQGTVSGGSTTLEEDNSDVAEITVAARDDEAQGEVISGQGASSASEAKASGAVSSPAKSQPREESRPQQEAPQQVQQDTTVRVDTKRLDDIMNLVGELVLVRNRLSTLRNNIANDEVDKAVGNLDIVTSDLQTAAMKTRMQPIKKVFGRFPRVVRDIARNLKKEVSLELIGEETDLDKNLVEALADPLVHLVRNAVDHGVEMPDEREAAGKPRSGTIVLSAEHAGDHIQLSIRDDGGGMDPDALRRKAVDKGIMEPESAERLTDRECYNLIFMPGFSTKDQISDVSGRGVGMDVVKNRISQLNGTIDIDSTEGQGTCIDIKVPLTLAILPTLMVVLGEQVFALPLANVSEIFDLDLRNTKVVDGQEVVLVRNSALPVFYLQRWLINGEDRVKAIERGHVVVVNIGTQHVGLVVDKLLGQEEVVIKPLGYLLQGTQGIAGATITGDGKIALILDIPGLLTAYGRKR